MDILDIFAFSCSQLHEISLLLNLTTSKTA